MVVAALRLEFHVPWLRLVTQRPMPNRRRETCRYSLPRVFDPVPRTEALQEHGVARR